MRRTQNIPTTVLHCALETGVKQKSGVQNEDGLIAAFHGGWLDAGNPEVLNTIDDYGFTLHVRLQIPDGQRDKPIISKGGEVMFRDVVIRPLKK